MTTTSDAWVIRQHAPSDLMFVFSAWLKSYWDALGKAPWPVDADGGVITSAFSRDHMYNVGQRALIATAIGSSTCVVACHRDDPDEIFGFACGRRGLLHYVYVKSPARRSGIGRALVASVVGDADRVQFTHLTRGSHWMGRPYKWQFDANF